MSEVKLCYKGLLVILGILLISTLACAERNYLEESLGLSDKEEMKSYLLSLSEDELLTMGNQIWCKDHPLGRRWNFEAEHTV